MGRWEPGAPERLEQAALELYAERGYDRTTVAEIAERAGVTERTFFRHFADKREVLFRGGELLHDAMRAAVKVAPDDASPIEVVGRALEAMAEVIGGRREHSVQRGAVVAASAELRERELIKMASLSAGLADALVARGVEETAAELVAETGIAVFRTGFTRWLADGEQRPLGKVFAAALTALRASV